MKRLIPIIALILMFAGVNCFLYFTITRRLTNNFGGTDQLKNVDVREFLPFEEESDLVRLDSSLRFDPNDDLPVLDGAAALVPVYAAVVDNCYPEDSVKYKGGEFSDDNVYGENFAKDSAMQYHNTIRGFNAVVDGSVDMFFTAHPSAEQMEYAKEQNAELEIVPVGREAFVFFVNSKNTIDGLTADQIKAIYRGEIKNWKDVGGNNRLINPLTRIKSSGSQTMMEHFMNAEIEPHRSPLSIFGGAIGYSFRYYLSGMVADENVKMLSVNGVFPDKENIKNGSYPISACFYVVYRKDNDNENIPKLLDWLLSAEGQKLIEESGYVGL